MEGAVYNVLCEKKRVKRGLIGKIFGNSNYLCTLLYFTSTS